MGNERIKEGKFNVGDRFTLLPEHSSISGPHGKAPSGVIVEISNWNYVKFDGCDCNKQSTDGGLKCCIGVAAYTINPDVTNTKEYQDKAKSLKEWFDNE